jgi:hypothetical protein
MKPVKIRYLPASSHSLPVTHCLLLIFPLSAFAARADRRLLTTAYRRQSFSTIYYLPSSLSPLPLRLAGHTQNIRGHKQIPKT